MGREDEVQKKRREESKGENKVSRSSLYTDEARSNNDASGGGGSFPGGN
jgi:hypothetical protein